MGHSESGCIRDDPFFMKLKCKTVGKTVETIRNIQGKLRSLRQ